jgi:hypothetical protein
LRSIRVKETIVVRRARTVSDASNWDFVDIYSDMWSNQRSQLESAVSLNRRTEP